MEAEKPPLQQTDEWEEYKSLSLLPGGFGEKRTEIWPKLLHAQPQNVKENVSDDEPSLHPDERQIRLDTERSFVLYPVESSTDKEKLQAQLNDLLVEIFRKRPKLNYFQGYHDIITVLLLTLDSELHFPCAEQLSLQRVRDSMGSTLEPVLGLLRLACTTSRCFQQLIHHLSVMKNLLRAADPPYAELLERTSPLPYYALPNLLTLFSHDIPTLPLIQHVFDYLLCRPPIYVVYLAAAIILSRKEDVERLEEEGEEGMMHSILSALPPILDDPQPADDLQPKLEPLSDSLFSEGEQESPREELAEVKLDLSDAIEHQSEASSMVTESIPDLLEHVEDSLDASTLTSEPIAKIKTESLPPSESSDDDAEPEDPARPSRGRQVWKPSPRALTDLLNQSDALYKSHPPRDPALHLSSIMGPQSVIFTWSPHPSDMPSSDEAERMVERVDLVVYPEEPALNPKERETKMPRRKRSRRTPGTGTMGLLVGAGVVLGVAVAISVYGARQGGDPTRDWRKLGRWVGGVLAGVSDKLIHPI
ncbi:TBC1 domain member 20 [Favolaschia claudopus]|uniref:TBC1 domain member 20 n=1 Tax=Favolaschia claudopus TaxID=2862362 RepID=A0AAW0BV99_9AGAR